MRAAPPVDAALAGGRPERMAMILLHALAGAVLAAWPGSHADWRPGWAWCVAIGLTALLAAVAGAWIGRRVLPSPAGRLRWNGAQWELLAGAAIAPLQRVVVSLDLGDWMLLRLHPVDLPVAHWRVARARVAPSAWHGLRVALAAHAGAAGAVSADEVSR